ncbi:MAG: DUF2075 domain-containing protein [Bacteroidota bacterium]
MIVYQATKDKFLDDVLSNDIENIILYEFKKNLKKTTQRNEIDSWKYSLPFMSAILYDPEIPADTGILIEFEIPRSGKRVDFIIAGQNTSKKDFVVLIELKQWSYSELTEKDGIVRTFYNRAKVETTHPSYQAWTYASLIQSYNETVYNEDIQLQPCVYMHNYPNDGIINHPFYNDHLEKAPVFLKNDAEKLREFIKKFIRYGDKSEILYRIDTGKIRPSKSLADSLLSMIKGNIAFYMIDDQKLVFEEALSLAQKSSEWEKNVLIVEGGAGTGKSVVAVNLLVQMTDAGMVAQYVTKNAAPRAVYESKLTGSFKKSAISNLFTGSGSFVDCPRNSFDALIIDEAHRLLKQGGIYNNLGENQIKELIEAAKFSVFFLDEDQKVTLKDIGDKDEIIRWANLNNCKVHHMELQSQFRCNGSDGYLNWLNNVLDIRETANVSFNELDFDFRIVASPVELRDLIFEKNRIDNKSRIVAGYCWDWNSKKYPELYDIEFPEFNFRMRWNLTKDGSLWLVSPSSVNEVGCIHTCQGLDLDYVGVIVGPDMTYHNNKIRTNPAMRSKHDKSIHGYKKLLENDFEKGKIKIDRLIKNTYKTLMTRGMKGCFVYFTDKETENYFRSRIQRELQFDISTLDTIKHSEKPDNLIKR